MGARSSPSLPARACGNVVNEALAVGRQVPADAPSDPGSGVLDRVPGEMRVPRGRLHLRMTKQLPDHREAFAQSQRPRSIRVAAGHEFARSLARRARECGARGAGDR